MMIPMLPAYHLHAQPASFIQIEFRIQPRGWRHSQWAASINGLDNPPTMDMLTGQPDPDHSSIEALFPRDSRVC